jgi:hypothetical protein
VLGVPEGVDGVVDVVVVVVAVSVFFVSVDVLEEAAVLSLGSAFLLPLLLYRSAYQPPPLRMKPAPPETWRLAVA